MSTNAHSRPPPATCPSRKSHCQRLFSKYSRLLSSASDYGDQFSEAAARRLPLRAFERALRAGDRIPIAELAKLKRRDGCPKARHPSVLEVALAFAREGKRLVITDINIDALSKAQLAVRDLGTQCDTYVADVSSSAVMEDLAQRVHAEHGVLDVLVNNAGVAFLGSFKCTPIAQWQRTLDINVLGVVHGAITSCRRCSRRVGQGTTSTSRLPQA